MLRRIAFTLAFIIATGAALLAAGPSSDVQAMSVLNQALSVAGGAQALGALRDFVAKGAITYYWGGQQVPGTATLRARGFDQFRLDANIPDGMRSYVVSHGVGWLKDTSGAITTIPYFNTINVGILSFPYAGIAARLADPLTVITDLGLVSSSSATQLHQIHVQRGFPAALDTNGALAGWCVTDYFLDPQTNLMLQVTSPTTLKRGYMLPMWCRPGKRRI